MPLTGANRLLAALARVEGERLTHGLGVARLENGAILYEMGDPIHTLYFPNSGQVSLLIVGEDGEEIESASVGVDGVVGLGGLMCGGNSFTRQRVHVAGIAATLAKEPFLEFLEARPAFRRVIAAHHDAFVSHILQSVYCQNMHTAAQRTIRWLLFAFDATRVDHLELTQEQLARALGLRRATVTLVLNKIVEAGLLRIERGRIAIADRPGLERLVCHCYAVVRDGYDRAHLTAW